MKRDFHFYRQLFAATFSVSAFTFGGGYVIVPLMKQKFCDTLHWIDEDEMLDIVAISQSLPGPMAVDASALVGYRLAGIPGALTALLATALPPLVILSVVSLFYQAFKSNRIVNAVLKGMQAGIAAVIADVVISGAVKTARSKETLSILIMAASFIAIYFLNINVIWVILACGALGGILAMVQMKRKKAPKA
ncbi:MULTISPECIES: chromate transporter [Caproicibacterium]|uniref:Chromate transporter n=1 Tax=Caproicibacterium lactatifermentans TaxID=2666138 RepID=A0A859DPY3_9FIRM|nr:chromate transporter [Caproicibacterium lactatifermentans]ARP50632.1 chromate transporter [Ruminococcaceae bacterium CPB6]MDD4807254.1 chromate transporter [Oscillospiraceae bacterium]QKN23634.1 chromate transporter [Caproicibacterium lactatifermentans]QKO29693.1 chromate transporter [Caproicibacterium lactatifermentans]